MLQSSLRHYWDALYLSIQLIFRIVWGCSITQLSLVFDRPFWWLRILLYRLAYLRFLRIGLVRWVSSFWCLVIDPIETLGNWSCFFVKSKKILRDLTVLLARICLLLTILLKNLNDQLFLSFSTLRKLANGVEFSSCKF